MSAPLLTLPAMLPQVAMPATAAQLAALQEFFGGAAGGGAGVAAGVSPAVKNRVIGRVQVRLMGLHLGESMV